MAGRSGRRWLRLGLLLVAAAVLVEGLGLEAEGGLNESSGVEEVRPGKPLISKGQLQWLTGVGGAVGAAYSYRHWEAMPDNIKALLACGVFMFVGPALITLNKHIMQECDFPYPLSLSSIGLLSSSLLAQVLLRTKNSELRPETIERMSGCNFYRIVAPLACTKAFALASGNAVFLYLSLGFISMLKSFTPAIVLIVMTVARVNPPVRPARWSVLLIVLGTAVTVQGELSYTVFGFLLMMASCLAEAISIVLNQKLLQNWSFSEVEAMYYVAGPSVLVMMFPAMYLEWEAVWRNERYLIFIEYPVEMLSAAALGTGVNFVTLGVIRLTSSMTVKVLNTFRCIILVAIGMVVYGETHSARQLWGYFLSLIGFVAYNFFQVKKDKAREVEEWVDSHICPQKGQNLPSKGRSEDDITRGGESEEEEGLMDEERPKATEEGRPGTPSPAKPQVVGKFLQS